MGSQSEKKNRKKDKRWCKSLSRDSSHPSSNLRCLGIWTLQFHQCNSPQTLLAEYFFPSQFFYMMTAPKCTAVLLHNAVAGALLSREVRMLGAKIITELFKPTPVVSTQPPTQAMFWDCWAMPSKASSHWRENWIETERCLCSVKELELLLLVSRQLPSQHTFLRTAFRNILSQYWPHVMQSTSDFSYFQTVI